MGERTISGSEFNSKMAKVTSTMTFPNLTIRKCNDSIRRSNEKRKTRRRARRVQRKKNQKLTITKRTSLIKKTSISTELFFSSTLVNTRMQLLTLSSARALCIRTSSFILKISSLKSMTMMDMRHQLEPEMLTLDAIRCQ